MRCSDTFTHVYQEFANPYLACETCGRRVVQWHNPEKCGCLDRSWQNMPCGHEAGATSVCPSWDPVDGCWCRAALGRVPHPEKLP